MIADFTPATDVIQFNHNVFADFGQVQSQCQQVGSDVVITADPNDTITLQHVVLADLHAGDFHFV